MKTDWIPSAIRDVMIWGACIFGIVHEEWTQHVSVELLSTYTVLLTTPAGFALFKLRGVLKRIDTNSSPSEPPSSSRSEPQ